jgi:hypothetical protein
MNTNMNCNTFFFGGKSNDINNNVCLSLSVIDSLSHFKEVSDSCIFLDCFPHSYPPTQETPISEACM